MPVHRSSSPPRPGGRGRVARQPIHRASIDHAVVAGRGLGASPSRRRRPRRPPPDRDRADRPSHRRPPAGGGRPRPARISDGPIVGRTRSVGRPGSIAFDERRSRRPARRDRTDGSGACRTGAGSWCRSPEVAELADLGHGAAEPAGTAGVGHDRVLLEADRVGGLGDLDRHVGVVRPGMGHALGAVAARGAAARTRRTAPCRRTAVPSGPRPPIEISVLPPSPSAGTRSGDGLRERAEHRLHDAEPGDPAGTARGRQHGVDDRRLRRANVMARK